MILDSYLLLGEDQAVTTTTATTSYIDTLAAGDANVGDWVVVRVGTAATADGSATVTFALQSDTDSGFATALQTDLTTAAIGKASLTADTIIWKARIPAGVKRYIRGYYTVATGPLTAGTFDMFIVKDADINALLVG